MIVAHYNENLKLIVEIEVPKGTRIDGKETESYFRDSYKFNTSKTDLQVKDVYHRIFGYMPKPVKWALKIRNLIAKPLGFSATSTEMSLPLEDIVEGKKAGFLIIEHVSDSEVVCGAYESNMDMWLSVLKLSEREFAISTLVNLKTRSGKLYMAFVKPFHKLVAKFCIRQALRAGRL